MTNNSYFADPFYYACPNDRSPLLTPQQRAQERAILKAESRAIRFAQNHGVGVVAAAGNFYDDLAHPTVDNQSPDNATPVTRPVDRSCQIVPVTLPGVIVVSADGNLRQKSFYSAYGYGVVDVTAPGGDSVLQATVEAPNGRVLSTVPPNPSLIPDNQCRANRTITLSSGDPAEPVAYYCYLQGTSMATPHVTGVAALILSRDRGQERGDGATRISRERLSTLINRATDPIACPSTDVLAKYAPYPSTINGVPQTCTGTLRYNSWYGHGQINALKAVRYGQDDDY